MNQMCSGSCSADWTLKLAFCCCCCCFLIPLWETLLPLLLWLFFVISVFLLGRVPPPKKKKKKKRSGQSVESALLVMHMNSKSTHGPDHRKRPWTCVGRLFLSTIWASCGAAWANDSLRNLEEAKRTWTVARRHRVTCHEQHCRSFRGREVLFASALNSKNTYKSLLSELSCARLGFIERLLQNGTATRRAGNEGAGPVLRINKAQHEAKVSSEVLREKHAVVAGVAASRGRQRFYAASSGFFPKPHDQFAPAPISLL